MKKYKVQIRSPKISHTCVPIRDFLMARKIPITLSMKGKYCIKNKTAKVVEGGGGGRVWGRGELREN
jgi:hypothetical protein